MSKPGLGMAASLVLTLSSSAVAQWVNVPGKRRTSLDVTTFLSKRRVLGQTPDLDSVTPRTPDGKPDLSGTWEADKAGFSEDLAAYLRPGELPIRAWAQAVTDERNSSQSAGVPTARCLPPGIPLLTSSAVAHPFKIVEVPGLVTILYEYFGEFRQIFLDGRMVSKDANPTWLGYSTGRWDGDVLVVDTRGFNGKTWLDSAGHPATEALHVTERFQRLDWGHLEIQLTIDDRLAYTKPWTVTLQMHALTKGELLEFVCGENEKDLRHAR
ncbi:MAG TPA: hypothetical protein VN841_07490 [Bryobacteraceae bacterium]|nr:hypothetical protein [Bryobacteraceae bacterium]